MNSDWEAQLDERLRQVPLPMGLVARLQQIGSTDPSLSELELAILSDDALDRQLCAIELPGRLIDRLQQDISSLAVAETLDAQLADVEVPHGLLRSLRLIPWELTHRKQVHRLALAASLMVVVGLGYATAVATWIGAVRDLPTREVAWIELDERPVSLEGATVEVAALESDEGAEAAALATEVDTADAVVDWVFEAPADVFPAINNVGPTRDVNAQFVSSDPWQDVLVMRWGVLGSPSDVSDRLPPLEALPRRRTTGIKPPLVRGFDRQFFVREGVPPAVPADVAALRSIEIPLTTSTESVRLAWQRLREGRLPDADEMHIADFIAAMEYPLPAARPGEVGLRTAAGPSPFGRDGARLLQVCAQMGALPEAKRQPTHLTIALDVSASMELGGKLETAKRSIRQMLAHLGKHDRVSLLLFNDRDQMEVITASLDEALVIGRLLDKISASGGTNLAAGLQRGASLAMSEGAVPKARRKLVLVTDGRAPMPQDTHAALVELFGELKREGLSLAVLDLSSDEEPDADLLALTKATQGNYSHPATADEAQWLLTDVLLGRPTIVAPDAALRVTFNPKAVSAYRLIGHEPSPLVGLEPATITLDLRAAQVATGLLEVWLKPNSENEVATAQLSWRDPQSGEPRYVEQPISRVQFASTIAESPLSLQAAMIAAETGEVLKGSPFVENRNRGLADVRDLAYRVHPRLAEREGFQQFVSLVEAAERLRVDRIVPK